MAFGRLSIGGGFFVLLALVWFVGGGELTACLVLASAGHELGHYMAAKMFGIKVERLCLSAMGAEMTLYGSMSYVSEAIVAVAGPAASLLLAVISAQLGCTMLAGLSFVLGLFNLLPVTALDGGAIIRSLAMACLHDPSERLCRAISVATCVVMALFGLWVLYVSGSNFTLLLTAVLLLANKRDLI